MNDQSPISSLHDLRTRSEPALLWDPDRHRIVWANRAAVQALGGETLFDAIDRHFTPADHAVKTLASLAQTIGDDPLQSARLAFTSVSPAFELNARITRHALADGRNGLLVAGLPAPSEEHSIAQLVLSSLPVATVLVSQNGVLSAPNEAARAIMADLDGMRFEELLLKPDRARHLLQQLAAQSTTASVEQAICPLGLRDLRLNLRKLASPAAFAVMTLEDVTERRAAELQMERLAYARDVPEAAQMSKTAALDQVARSMADTLRNAAPTAGPPVQRAELPPAPPRAETPAAPPRKPASVPVTQVIGNSRVPETIRKALEASGKAIAIVKAGKLAFATTAARSAYALDLDATLEQLNALPKGQPFDTELDLADTEGNTVRAQVSARLIPWQDGPALQVALKPAPKPAPKPVATPPADSPEPVKSIVTLPQSSAQIAISQQPKSRDASLHATPNDELKAILDVASDGIVTLDQDGAILSFSAGAEAIFGHTEKDVLNQTLESLLASESRKTWRDYLASLQGPGLASVFNDGREVNATTSAGGTVPLFLTVGRLQSPNASAKFCAVVRDITPWKRTEQELRDARDLAEAASQQKSAFLAHLSHELRTPLNAIMGFSEVMQQERFGAMGHGKYKDYANDIHASGRHLLSLIDDLLDLSRVEAGKLELNFAAVDLVDVVNHAVRMLEGEAGKHRVILRKSLPKALPRVVADLKSMHQVLLNLVANAIKFTEPGGQVIISAELNGEGELALRINDNGIGMNQDQVRDALQPFRRVTTQGRETPGTGLGLPLSKALVEANRARFELVSEPGEGTLVEIIFPTTRVLAE